MARQKRCRICKREGFIHLRYANLPLCKEHFLSRTRSVVQDTIKKFKMFSKEQKVIVAVSGGKDSMALWHILAQLDYKVEGIHIDLGLREFSMISRKISEEFAETHGLKLHVFSLKEELGSTIDEIVKKSYEKPCSVCGTIKRYMLNRLTYEMGGSVLATGHNLDDESARLMGNILNWEEEYLYRQYPVLPEEEGMVKKVKPVVFLTRKELLKYCEAEQISYVDVSCPHSRGARSLVLLDIMEMIEDKYPATKLRFVKGFYKIREKFAPSKKVELHKCVKCGMLTASNKDLCRFCRIKERMEKNEAIERT